MRDELDMFIRESIEESARPTRQALCSAIYQLMSRLNAKDVVKRMIIDCFNTRNINDLTEEQLWEVVDFARELRHAESHHDDAGTIKTYKVP